MEMMIVAFPGETAVTNPSSETVATLILVDEKAGVANEPGTVAEICCVSPTTRKILGGETDRTGMGPVVAPTHAWRSRTIETIERPRVSRETDLERSKRDTEHISW
jgi:hypothetical protein